ncbi:MAG: hypothetical protein JXA74_05970 [Anaerolineae bacterium]|nr:hypothetical protein [Anaerolineae bacterium]
MTRLTELRWHPLWMSYIGCLKGCLDYLHLDVSLPWLYGASGHAFVLNVHEVVCPSGPTAWGDGQYTTKLVEHVGCRLEQVTSFRSQPGFDAARERAWGLVRRALDAGQPCLGWELDIPEFYCIQGYDEAGYYYSGPGCDAGKGPKPWRELAETEIGWLEVAAVSPGEPLPVRQTVHAALAFALAFAESPPEWVHEGYKGGLAGYDQWITALEGHKADGFGMAYNAAVWHECREHAAAFLPEARKRLEGAAEAPLAQAAAAYESVARRLGQVEALYPFHGLKPEHIADEARRSAALDHLRAAREAEADGLKALAEVVAAL